jgi:hypothetical protein
VRRYSWYQAWEYGRPTVRGKRYQLPSSRWMGWSVGGDRIGALTVRPLEACQVN